MNKIFVALVCGCLCFLSCASDGATSDTKIELLKSRALNGDAADQYKLGVLYRDGQIVKFDLSEAAKWFKQSANQGYKEAEESLGEFYFSGVVDDHPNYEESYFWFMLAAHAGDKNAEILAALAAQQLDEYRVVEIQQRIAHWNPKAVHSIIAELRPAR